VTLAERPEADGEIWHLPAAPPLTAQQVFDLIFEAAGRPTPAKARTLQPAMLAIAGVLSPLMRELRETAYQFRAPFVVDFSKFERAFGSSTPRRTATRSSTPCSGFDAAAAEARARSASSTASAPLEAAAMSHLSSPRTATGSPVALAPRGTRKRAGSSSTPATSTPDRVSDIAAERQASVRADRTWKEVADDDQASRDG
jgi:hypothetical protein